MVKLRIVEALQDDAYKGVARIDGALMKKLGLERVLSKWNKESLEYYKDFQRIDVTEQVIEIPEPNKKQRRSALEIRKHKPLTKEQLEKNKSSM